MKQRMKGITGKLARPAERFLFPAVLLIYPLLWADQGIELADSMYSLTNFRFFPQLEGTWMVATYLANVMGWLLMKLPFGGTLLGISFYTRLMISAMALLSYYFLKGKMPASAAFLGEILAISFCWCPSTILYNYLTYFLFLLGSILLYRGLIWERKGLLLGAGVCLGLNGMVRLPNLAETALILAVFYYGRLANQKMDEVWKNVGVCVAGFLTGFLAAFALVCIQYGPGAWFGMFTSLAGYSATDESYSPFSMVTSVLKAYEGTLIWAMLLGSCILAGWIFFRLLPPRFHRAGKAVYCICIPVLLRLFWGRGMFTFTYYNYRSMYEWGMLLLYLILLSCLFVMADAGRFRRDRLLALMVLLSVAVTPLGSNNGTMPSLNNLFLAAPFALGALGQGYVRYGRRPLFFPAVAITVTVLAVTVVQGIGFRARFAFGDGIYGEKRDAKVDNSDILIGMRTRVWNAENLSGLLDFMENQEEAADSLLRLADQDRRGQEPSSAASLITFGNAPGLHYLLDLAPALTHSWPDLDTYPSDQMKVELDEAALLSQRPLIILYQENGRDLEEEIVQSLSTEKQKKWRYLQDFLQDGGYTLLYENEGFQVFG